MALAHDITALEMISQACQGAGFTRVSKEQIEKEDSFANKAYYFLLDEIADLTATTPDWGWNDDSGTATTVANQTYVTLDTDANPNFVSWVAIDQTTGYNFLLPLWKEDTLIREIYPTVADISTAQKPLYWYIKNGQIELFPKPDQAYSLRYGFQKLQQSFLIDDVDSTNLDITPDTWTILKIKTEVRIQAHYGGENKAGQKYERYCDPNNHNSLMSKIIENNRLYEKRNIRFKPIVSFRKEEHI